MTNYLISLILRLSLIPLFPITWMLQSVVVLFFMLIAGLQWILVPRKYYKFDIDTSPWFVLEWYARYCNFVVNL